MMNTTSELPPPPSIQSFQRVPLLLVAALALLSLGFYVPYWLYTRSRIINEINPAHPIPFWFMALCMGGFLMLLGLILQFPEGMTAEEWMASESFKPVLRVAIVVNGLMLLWSAIFLHRLNLAASIDSNDPRHGNYFFLVLVHLLIVSVFYLQYKINQHLDQHSSGTAIM